MSKKQRAKVKRDAKTKGAEVGAIYDGENLLLTEPLRLPRYARVRIKIERKRNRKNGRKEISATLEPQPESAEMIGAEIWHTDDSIPQRNRSEQEIEDIVRRMAHEHFEIEEFLDRIIWLKSGGDEEEIHLIEVNRDTIPSGSVMPFYIRESNKFPLAARLADVTPDEWEKIQAGEIPLPRGWSLKNTVEFEREQCLEQGFN